MELRRKLLGWIRARAGGATVRARQVRDQSGRGSYIIIERGDETDALQHREQRHREVAEGGSRLRATRHLDMGGAEPARDRCEGPPRRDRHQAGPPIVRLLEGSEGLL